VHNEATHTVFTFQGTRSTSTIIHLSRLIPTPHTTRVYASNTVLPLRLQDSVPVCLLHVDRMRRSLIGTHQLCMMRLRRVVYDL
jgi:hypothetical protein